MRNMINKIVCLILLLSFPILAQKVTVVEIMKLEIGIEQEIAYPKFTADDNKIIFTSPNFQGLYKYDLTSGDIEIISNGMGAGYNPRILNDGNIYYKTFDLINGRKLYSINKYNSITGKNEVLDVNVRLAKIPFQRTWDEVYYLNNSVIKKQSMEKTLSKSNESDIAVYVENNDLILINGNEKILLNPLGKGVYVWESISPDGKSLLFSFGNQGTFVININGQLILNIEEAHYPRFSPDGKYISFMKDKDDGHNYTESDIFIYSIEDEESYKVTDTEDRIEMYPNWSNDGTKLVYHTIEGELFVAELKYDN
ncbi:MAG: hypothetical protein R3250_16060 [Melioribacteraceae bacterium]|nr:hypothetical protein [Melioribacteraceae bacterium]